MSAKPCQYREKIPKERGGRGIGCRGIRERAFDAELAALFALEAAAAVVAVTEFVARSGVRAEAAGTFLSAMCSSLG